MQVLRVARRGRQISWTRATQCECRDLDSVLLAEQEVLSTAKPSLQPRLVYFIIFVAVLFYLLFFFEKDSHKGQDGFELAM